MAVPDDFEEVMGREPRTDHHGELQPTEAILYHNEKGGDA